MTFNLFENTYKPYKKPGDKILYIHRESNHPQKIKKEMSRIIEKRLSKNSKNKEIFDENKKEYQDALKRSGYKETLKYNPEKIEDKSNEKSIEENKKKKNRKRKIIWYNPPYNDSVKNNIGQRFLKIIDKHFGKKRADKFDKIFNRNTLKIGYSCTQNIGSIIKAHNKKILQKDKDQKTETTEKTCNCRNKTQCPLQEKCLTQCSVYKINIENKNNNEINKTSYIGSTEDTFKKRFYQHKSDLNIKENKNKTTFANYIWKNKEKGIDDKTSYEILEKCKPYKSGNKYCQVCVSECYQILKAKRSGQNILNKRKEYFPSCKHKQIYKLIAVKKLQQPQQSCNETTIDFSRRNKQGKQGQPHLSDEPNVVWGKMM